MKDNEHIPEKDRLSQYQQVSTMIFHILSVAQAGGLSEKKAQATYRQILDAYSTMKGEAFLLFRDELIRILVTPDSHFEDGGKGSGVSVWSRN